MSNHMKRLNAPRTMRLHRKEEIWTVRASPGPHKLLATIPLGIIVRDYLKLCDTLREAKYILQKGEIQIDGQIRKEYKFSVGFMDVITIPTIKKHFRVLYDQRGKFALVEISSAESEWKLRRIEGKSILPGKKTQLNFHDGFCLLVEKDEYHSGDVLRIAFQDRKIVDIYPRAKGTIALITGGSHIGELATIKELEVIASSKPNLAIVTGVHDFTTLEQYVFPVGKTKSVVSLPEVRIQ
ncbi:MAG: 30S ribosomal protein S4e [Thermoplasmatota archaeon]